jgi:hypothetical protein
MVQSEVMAHPNTPQPELSANCLCHRVPDDRFKKLAIQFRESLFGIEWKRLPAGQRKSFSRWQLEENRKL